MDGKENSPDPAGTRIGRYVVESLIGSGGMGAVYLAKDPLLNRKVALKRIHRRREGGPDERRRVLREARRASKIADPRIAAVHDVLDLEDEVVIVMERVEGRTLRAVIREKPSVDDFWHIAEECTQAFAVAHREGVLHRDIKPENIMITKSGGVKVLDFGLARPLTTGRHDDSVTTLSVQDAKHAGTPPYMAPESLLGRAIDERSDIFSLGVTFYELLTGARPFHGPTPHALAQEILNTEPAPPSESNGDVPASLSTIVLRMLSKDPSDRYASVEEVLRDLRDARGGAEIIPLPGAAKPPAAAPSPSRPWIKLAPAAAALVATIVFLTLGGLDRIRERLGWVPLPAQKHVVFLPMETEGGDEDLTAMALGVSSLVGAGLHRLSADSSLHVALFIDTVRYGLVDPRGGRERQGANLVFQSSMEWTSQELRATMRLSDAASGRTLRSGDFAALRSRPHDFVKAAFLKAVSMVGVSTGGLDPEEFLDLGTAGAGTLENYLVGLGRIIGVLRGRFDVTEADSSQIRAAVEAFDRAARIDPDHAPSLSGLARACRKMYRATRDTTWLERAEDAARRAISRDDSLADAHKRLAFVFWERGERTAAAEEMRKAVQLDPFDDVALSNLGVFYRSAGRADEEEVVYRSAAEARPNDWFPPWCLAIRVYYRQGRFHEAGEALEEVIRRSPDLYMGYQSLGGMQVLEGDYERAVTNLERSISLRPNAEALGNLGVAYFNLRDFERSIETFNEVFQHKVADHEDWLNLGDAYYYAPGSRDKAARAYDQAIRLGREELRRKPGDSMILGTLAQMYPKVGLPDSARAFIEEALELDPTNPMIQYDAAVTYWQLNERHTALDWLEKSVAGGYPASWLRDSPMFDDWRSDERFQSIVPVSEVGS